MNTEFNIEPLAAIEHQRWAHWQKYMHNKCTLLPSGDLLIPSELVTRWERQIDTEYKDLCELEKQSDREQVLKYLPEVTNQMKHVWQPIGDAPYNENVLVLMAPHEYGLEDGEKWVSVGCLSDHDWIIAGWNWQSDFHVTIVDTMPLAFCLLPGVEANHSKQSLWQPIENIPRNTNVLILMVASLREGLGDDKERWVSFGSLTDGVWDIAGVGPDESVFTPLMFRLLPSTKTC